MGTYELVILTVIGLAAGLVGGLLGVGGSIVMIPAMTELLGPDQHLYQAAAMIVNFFVAVPAVYQHRRAGAIDLRTVVRVLPLSLLAVVLGVTLSELHLFAGANEAYLRLLFGLFLLSVASADLYRALRRDSRRAVTEWTGPADTAMRPSIGWGAAAAVAMPVGFVAGLLGVGGGVLAVPMMRKLLKTPIRTAIANSATFIVGISFVGAIAKNLAVVSNPEEGYKPLALAAILIPTAIGGSLIGSRLTHKLPLRVVKIAFFVLLLVAALRLIQGALMAAPIHAGPVG